MVFHKCECHQDLEHVVLHCNLLYCDPILNFITKWIVSLSYVTCTHTSPSNSGDYDFKTAEPDCTNMPNIKRCVCVHKKTNYKHLMGIPMYHHYIHSFHWHVQNAMIPRHSQLPPFLTVIYPFPPTSLPSYLTSSCHLFLGLPPSLAASKFIYNTFFWGISIFFHSLYMPKQM